MAGRGRPTKPAEQKRRLGNPGKRALPALSNVVSLAPMVEIPDAPRPLGPAGAAVWNRVWPAARHWLSPEIDLEYLLTTCEMIDERVALRIRVLRDGQSYDRHALLELTRQIQTSLGVLGFSPSDRAKLGLAEVKTRTKLEELREKHTAKVAD